MSLPVWRLDDNIAELKHDGFTAHVDLLHPSQGLRLLGDDSALAGAHLLGVEVPSCRSDDDLLVDRHVRGEDLVVAYRQTSDWPVHVDVLWRALSIPHPDQGIAAAELLVSVWTELLDSRPELSVRSVLGADEMLRLADAGASRFKPLSLEREHVLGPGEGPGCLLFRWQSSPLSYAEIVHPADFYRDELAPGPEILVQHRLFPQNLEKGVILRARVRSLLLPRENDETVVAGVYRDFAAADPPLGT